MNLDHLIFLDTETTGLDPDRHDVWEIAYAIGEGPIINFQRPLFHGAIQRASAEALEINRFHERYVQPDIDSYFEEFDRLQAALRGRHLVGSNPAFDAAFLRPLVGPVWHHRMVDLATYAMPAARSVTPLGMAAVAELFDVEQTAAHTAADDVHVLRECFLAATRFYEDVV